jgi:hypothetical protein
MRSGAGGAAEHSSPGRAVARRRWYRPRRQPLPAEPGRLVVCALLGRARRARGCRTPGDDRIETRVYAVKRYLFRLAHAAGSARYATSIEQLVVGLAPVMGWGSPPRGGAERARFVARIARACSAGSTTWRSPGWSLTSRSGTTSTAGGGRRSSSCRRRSPSATSCASRSDERAPGNAATDDGAGASLRRSAAGRRRLTPDLERGELAVGRWSGTSAGAALQLRRRSPPGPVHFGRIPPERLLRRRRRGRFEAAARLRIVHPRRSAHRQPLLLGRTRERARRRSRLWRSAAWLNGAIRRGSGRRCSPRKPVVARSRCLPGLASDRARSGGSVRPGSCIVTGSTGPHRAGRHLPGAPPRPWHGAPATASSCTSASRSAGRLAGLRCVRCVMCRRAATCPGPRPAAAGPRARAA